MSKYLKFCIPGSAGGCLGGARAENIGRAAVALTGQKERWSSGRLPELVHRRRFISSLIFLLHT